MDSSNSQFETSVEYKEGDQGTGAWGIKPGPGAIPPIPAGPDTVVEEEDFDTDPIWSQISFAGDSGTGVWSLATDSFHSAPRSYKSPVLSSGEFSTFSIFNFAFQPDLIFWARVDGGPITNGLINGLVVSVDGTEKLVVSEFDTGWVKYIISLDFGFQIDFKYQRDFGAFVNRAWVDNIVFGERGTPAVPGSPAHPWVYTPLVLTANDELKVSLTDPIEVEVINEVDVIVLNEVDVNVLNEVPVVFDRLDCATDSVTVCIDEPLDVNIVNTPIAVTVNTPGGTLNNGVQTAVGAAAVQIAAASAGRKKLIIQNVGIANIRFGTTGVTATTGTRLVPGGHAIFDMPDCPTNAIFAIREGAVSSTVIVQQVT